MTFDEFFRQATGHPCYAYQKELAEAASWPSALIAPTGMGKTAAVVLGWLWRRARMPDQTPRRLVYCLPMRSLVDQTAESVRSWVQALGDSAPIRREGVHLLMGGFDGARWDLAPETPAVLIGTQDLLLSRALMRGFAMSRYRWPVDFALLHNDAQWVFDEVQLMDSGLATSTQLEGFRRKVGTAAATQSLWVSATLHPGWLRTVDLPKAQTTWRVLSDFPADAASERVRNLVDAPKSVRKSGATFGGLNSADIEAYAREVASEVVGTHRSGYTTLIILNTVARARAVHKSLRKMLGSDRLVLIHSRFRPADRQFAFARLPKPREQKDLIVVATQAIEAGVDLSAAVLITELAPISSLAQRIGRVNRYGELNSSGGGSVRWVDILGSHASAKEAESSSAPYSQLELKAARSTLTRLIDGSPANLPAPSPEDFSHQAVVRFKDLLDLFDTDPDLTGFDVDVSPYIRQSDDTDVRVLWREFDLGEGPLDGTPPRQDELCPIPISGAREWLAQLRRRNIRAYRLDPQTSKAKKRGKPPWIPLDLPPWPGLVVLVHRSAGGYTAAEGFDLKSKLDVEPIRMEPPIGVRATGNESNEADGDSLGNQPVALTDHLRHVEIEAERLCDVLGIEGESRAAVMDAARWHDVGKAHAAFQSRLTNGEGSQILPGVTLAKAPKYDLTKGRLYFRHELASALAYLTQAEWSRDSDLVAYLIAAHHGKVRLNLRAYPAEQRPRGTNGQPDERRFARGVWEGDVLPDVSLGSQLLWHKEALKMSVMDIGEHPVTGASWAERTRGLLHTHGPFRVAWLEAVVRIADWRASANEQ